MQTTTLILAALAALSSVIALILTVVQTLRTYRLREDRKTEFESYVEQLEAQLEEANEVIESQRSESEAVRAAKQHLEERLHTLRSEVEGREPRQFTIEAEIVSASSGTATASSYLSEALRREGIESTSPEMPLVVLESTSRRDPSGQYSPSDVFIDLGEPPWPSVEKDDRGEVDQMDNDTSESRDGEAGTDPLWDAPTEDGE